jgi:signal transduction histidine kinase
VYAEILAGLKVTPEELKRKIDYYQERAALLTHHAADLEQKVRERTKDLEAAQEELIKREKLSVLGQLTAIVSHELRNPLGVIRSSTYYLNRKLASTDEKTAKHLARIEQQVAICDSIIGELLEYTRGRRSAVSQGEISRWLGELLDQMPPPDAVTVVRDMAPDLPVVYFDKEKMRRVVINLYENAIQATMARKANEEGSSYIPRIKIGASREPGGVSIQVRDNGTGMDKETAARAFEPLFTTRARGTGLGLAIVRKIVQEHGGAVALSSALNHGTTITVTIPDTPRMDGPHSDEATSQGDAE